MKKLHSSRTEIFSNRIRTKTVINRGWGFGVKVFVSECSYETGGGRATPCAIVSQDWIPCFRADASRYPGLRKDSAFVHTPQRRSCPRKMYPWRSGTMTALRGLKLKVARLQSSVGCCSFPCSVVHLYLCYQAGFYFVLLKHKFKSMNISRTMLQRFDWPSILIILTEHTRTPHLSLGRCSEPEAVLLYVPPTFYFAI